MSGLSKIISSQYQGTAAVLLDGNPKGPIVGGNADSQSALWLITVVGGNEITIQNTPTGAYANPSSETEGASVVGGLNPYRWRQLSVPGGWYQLATTDGNYVWFLTTGPLNRAPIVLKSSSYKGSDSQWAFEPAARVP